MADAVLLRPRFFRAPDQLVNLSVEHNGRAANGSYSPAAWQLLQARDEIFAAVEAYRFSNVVVTGGVEAREMSIIEGSPGLLRMLGIEPRLGRLFDAADARGAHGPVVVISDGLWRDYLGSSSSVIGSTIAIDDTPHIVIGVMPRTFAFPRTAFRAWTLLPPTLPDRPALQLVGRLRDDMRVAQAYARVAALRPAIKALKGITQDRDAAVTEPTNIIASDRTPIYVLLGAVVLVLTLACVNVASMMLAAGETRQREFALCTALGASRRRLMRQLLFESVVIASLSGAGGVWLATAGVRALNAIMPGRLAFFNANDIRVDGRILAFAAITAMIAVIIAGVVPAFRTTRTDRVELLKGGGRAMTAAPIERRALSVLAIVQCALAVLLLIGAGALVRSFVRLTSVDPGFDTSRLAIFSIVTRSARYADPAAQLGLRTAVVDSFRATPGVFGVAIAAGFPPDGYASHFDAALEIDTPGHVVARELEIAYAPVGPGYFELLGIPILAGRTVDDRDEATAVVIGEPFARRYWGSAAQAIGRQFRVGPDAKWQTIVGVAGDVKQMGLDDRYGDLEYYTPWATAGAGWSLAVRTNDAPTRIIPLLKQRVWDIDPAIALRNSDDMQARIAESIDQPRFYLTIVSVLAAVATGIAALGIYGLLAYLVARRTTEIGIRLAVGATPRQAAWLVIRDACGLVVVGAACGLAAAWGLARVMTSLLFQTSPLDPVAVLLGPAALATAAAAAHLIPARRARRVDPLMLLKADSV